jgi:hypothetical protein
VSCVGIVLKSYGCPFRCAWYPPCTYASKAGVKLQTTYDDGEESYKEAEGIVTVRFKEHEGAEKFQKAVNGRNYNYNNLVVSIAEDRQRFQKSAKDDKEDSDDEGYMNEEYGRFISLRCCTSEATKTTHLLWMSFSMCLYSPCTYASKAGVQLQATYGDGAWMGIENWTEVDIQYCTLFALLNAADKKFKVHVETWGLMGTSLLDE